VTVAYFFGHPSIYDQLDDVTTMTSRTRHPSPQLISRQPSSVWGRDDDGFMTGVSFRCADSSPIWFIHSDGH